MRLMIAALLLIVATALGARAEEKTSMKYDLGVENPKWKFVAGQWGRRASGGRQVLAQTTETQPWAVAILEDQKFSDVDVSVRFRPISGKEDASGGIIFRAKDGRNYFLVRANALENNFRLYTLVNGKRSTIASARVTEPSLGAWHSIRVVALGPKIQAYLNGTLLLDHSDKTFTDGWLGLWTKADSVTEFADMEVIGTVVKRRPAPPVPYFTNTHSGLSSGNAMSPMIAVAATSIGLLTFQRNRTTRLPSATNAVSQSPIAIFPSNTHAPRIVPMAAAYAPLMNPCTFGFV